MSILSEIRQQKHSLDDLAKLPQSMIMQMAQRKQIMPEMVAPILSRKAEMADAVAKAKALQSANQAMAPTTVLERLIAKNAEAANPIPQQQQMPPQMAPRMAGLGQMQSPTQLAGGGIVAFAKGEYVDGEEQDPEEEYEEFDRQQAILNTQDLGRSQFRSKIYEMLAPVSPTTESYKPEKNSVMEKPPEQSGPEIQEHVVGNATSSRQPAGIPDPLDHPYAGMVAQDAKKYGNDPKLTLRLLNNETGGIKNPEIAVSPAGAVGIAQFMPRTSKQYNIDPTNPKQSSDAMNKHIHHLMKEYGDPQLVAIAYNWGEGNTNRWLKTGADVRMLPKETRNYLDKFMRTVLAAGGEVKGYADGGSVAQGSYMNNMKRVFGYDPFDGPAVKKYLSGGEVKHFDKGSSVKALPQGSVIGQELKDFFGRITKYANTEQDGFSYSEAPVPQNQAVDKSTALQKAANKSKKNNNKTAEKAVVPEKSASSDNVDNAPPYPQSRPSPEQTEEVAIALQSPALQPPVLQNPTTVDNDDVFDSSEYTKLLNKLAQQQRKYETTRREDKAYEMIMAGLATMAGESPDAFTNIAKGQGVGLGLHYENRKNNAAEDARLMQLEGTVLGHKDRASLAHSQHLSVKEQKKERLALEKFIAENSVIAKAAELDRKSTADAVNARQKSIDALAAMKDHYYSTATIQYKEMMATAASLVVPAEQEAMINRAKKILDDAASEFTADPVVKSLRKKLYPEINFDLVKPIPLPKPYDTTKFKVVK